MDIQLGQGPPVRLVRVADGHPRPLGQHRLDVVGLHGELPPARLPLLALHVQLPAESPLHVAQDGGLLEVLAADRVGQLASRLGHPALQPLELRGQGLARQPGLRRRLVHQVDGLIG